MIFTILQQLKTAITALVIMTIITSILYPLSVWFFAVSVFRYQAQGSTFIHGSTLIGQDFTQDDSANPHNPWFIGRPSANYYNSPQVGINHDHNNASLTDIIKERQRNIVIREHITLKDIPADAVTTSASELDPYISFSYAQLQVARIARENSLPTNIVQGFLIHNTSRRSLKFLGQPRVNVVTLNRQLSEYISQRKTYANFSEVSGTH